MTQKHRHKNKNMTSESEFINSKQNFFNFIFGGEIIYRTFSSLGLSICLKAVFIVAKKQTNKQTFVRI